jgi:DNA mismatch repair protein MutL
MKRLAMARPDIGFTVEHDGRRVLAVQPTMRTARTRGRADQRGAYRQ